MPRYFFNVHDDWETEDEEGTDLPDLATAKREAVRYAGELMADLAGRFWDGRSWCLQVSDSSGVVFTLTFSGVVAPDRPS